VLEEAARQFGAQLAIQWHAFELRPAPIPMPDPDSGYIQEHWENRVLPMAGTRGLAMRIPRKQMRSRRALQAAMFAQDHGRFLEMDRRLFRARFEQDEDVSDIEVLKRLARESGLDDEALAYTIKTNAYLYHFNQDLSLAAQIGISGVPTALVGPEKENLREFLNDSEPVVGAVPYDWLASAIERALLQSAPLK